MNHVLPASRRVTALKLTHLLPAALMAASVTGVAAAARLFPSGPALLLVRSSGILPQGDAGADIRLVGFPAAGFALVYGDAVSIRAAMGFAVPAKGMTSCLP